MKKFMTFLLVVTAHVSMASQGSAWWKDVSSSEARITGDQAIATTDSRVLKLSLQDMTAFLTTAPLEFTEAAKTAKTDIELPMPDGSFQRFRILESPVCAPELAAKFPETRTWTGYGLDDATATLKLDVTVWGFHAMILSAHGDIYIDPFNLQTTEFYISYYRSNCIRNNKGSCLYDPEETWNKKQAEDLRAIAGNHPVEARSAGETLRTYDLAVACTGEYATYYGGTVVGAHGGIVTSVNRVNGVYEKELSVRMVLVPNNDTLIFLNSATDPYDNFNGGNMLSQNQTTVNNRIGAANYDIGHVFSTGGGGIAGLGVVCASTQKARGVTGSPAPINDPFDIDYVAHEMGHQFGGNHTFNSVSGGCGGGTRNGGTAYEPGSGITIMAYAGLCGGDNLASNSIAYFHTASFDEIENYIEFANGSTCPVLTPTGNNPPVSALTDYQYDIPLNTPFKLTGAGSDPDNDTITYAWEQYDLGPGGAWNAPSGNAPIFGSIVPTLTPERLFPRLNNILVNNNLPGNMKPTYARTLTFRMILRDNRTGGGGVTYDDVPVEVNVVNTTVPFAVTYPNTTGISWAAGTSQTITWDVASTTSAPINTQNVNIYLSTTGGTTYPFPNLIAANVPNNGSYTFTVPNSVTNTARILIEAADNIFLDINDKNFAITPPIGVNENIALESADLVPNPAQTDLQLIMSGPVRGEIKSYIYDASGKIVSELNFNKNMEGSVFKIDVASFESGIYTVVLQTNDGNITKRFTKI